jgi:hypothetical protein
MTAIIPQPHPRGNDPLLDEIRAVKESVSVRVEHDVARLCQELRRDQEASGRRIVRRKGSPPRVWSGREVSAGGKNQPPAGRREL